VAAFPFTVELADGRRLTVAEAIDGSAYSLQAEGDTPCPIDDPDALLQLSLVLELAATRRRNDRDDAIRPSQDRDRASP
jgi:hypothetical protein